MKIKVKNLGVLKEASFSVGEMTIICGENNTGKTYATYSLFGFLSSWEKIITIDITETEINQLLEDGVVQIDVLKYFKNLKIILEKCCQEYTKQLPEIFATPSERFAKTEFKIEINPEENQLNQPYQQSISSAKTNLFSLIKKENSQELIVTLLGQINQIKIPKDIIKQVISDALKEIIFRPFFPKAFIASAERTGTAIFRKELNFARNRLLEEISKSNQELDPFELLFKGYDDYALPIKSNVEFTRKLETIAKKTSFIAEKYPDLLKDFADIIGGEYIVTKNDELYYVPKGNKIKLSMDESSSAVRSLLDIGFYLKHIAQKGDLLIVDEPELNLHPENQRRVARLFARLINLGIKVFITTHSDYLIKELNTLIMLNQDKSYLREIAQREGYQKDELLDANQIKVYLAQSTLIKLEDKQRKTNCQTLILANINQELGIEIGSFDTAIETMNRIQEAIIWGEE